MTAAVAHRAAEAMRWRALQLAGVQLVYFLRLVILANLLALPPSLSFISHKWDLRLGELIGLMTGRGTA